MCIRDRFCTAFFDLPGKAILLNAEEVRSSIDSDCDYVPVGEQAILVFPSRIDKIVAIRDQHFGRNSMIFMNFSCRRSMLASKINDSFDRFSSPETLVDNFKALPLEAATAMMNDIDMAACESNEMDGVDVIHDASHAPWLKQFVI